MEGAGAAQPHRVAAAACARTARGQAVGWRNGPQRTPWFCAACGGGLRSLRALWLLQQPCRRNRGCCTARCLSPHDRRIRAFYSTLYTLGACAGAVRACIAAAVLAVASALSGRSLLDWVTLLAPELGFSHSAALGIVQGGPNTAHVGSDMSMVVALIMALWAVSGGEQAR